MVEIFIDDLRISIVFDTNLKLPGHRSSSIYWSVSLISNFSKYNLDIETTLKNFIEEQVP